LLSQQQISLMAKYFSGGTGAFRLWPVVDNFEGGQILAVFWEDLAMAGPKCPGT